MSRFTYGSLQNGEVVRATRIETEHLTAVVLDYGLRLTQLQLKLGNGKQQNLILGGYPLDQYELDTSYLGAVVGRTCNRIAGGHLELNGKTFDLDRNEGQHHLHGGGLGLHNQVWQVGETGHGLVATTTLEDGASGYPGKVNVRASISIEGDTLRYEYHAISDSDTLFDVTNHAYFCLDDSGSVLAHRLQVSADRFVEVDSEMIPTGRLLSVAGSPFDFRLSQCVGDRMDEQHPQIELAGGFDHSWLLVRGEAPDVSAVLRSELTGIQLEVTTTSPAIQVYTGNHLAKRHSGICLETQHLPDACHHENFLTPILFAEQPREFVSTYRFIASE